MSQALAIMGKSHFILKNGCKALVSLLKYSLFLVADCMFGFMMMFKWLSESESQR